MPDTYHSLLGHDLGHLRIVADFWGLELRSTEPDAAARELSAALLDPERLAEVLAALPQQAQAALQELIKSNGRIPQAAFFRQYGELREMGAGRRDREQPHLNAASASEVLFYRALVGRAFFDADGQPQEFTYIPEDLLELLIRTAGPRQGREAAGPAAEPLGRAAAPAERAIVLPASDRILDDATTLLAALRLGRQVAPDPRLRALLHAAGLLQDDQPQAEAVRRFLEAPRREALAALIAAWRDSESFDELRLMPGIICEGEWKNQPLATRGFLLDLCNTIPEGKWWSVGALVGDVRAKHPDFERPAGDYDSWFIRRASDGQYLRGFGSWPEVDGALIRFFITEVLAWLGMAELASPQEANEASAFRLLRPEGRPANAEEARLHVSSQGRILVPRSAPRAVRYQIARFCEWEEAKPDEYRFRITARTLAAAGEQGLKVEQLLALLARHSDAGIPPVLVKALKRWEAAGTEAQVQTQAVLRVSRPEVLEELRRSKAARFLGEPLGPTAAAVKGGAVQKVLEALAELGLLAEDRTHEK